MGTNWTTTVTRHIRQQKSVYKYIFLVPAICIVIGYPWIIMSARLTSTIPHTIGTDLEQYLIPNDDSLMILSDMQLLDMFTKYINSHQIMCRNLFRLGSFQDGGKYICIDKKVQIHRPCLVYSFGKIAEASERDIQTNKFIVRFLPDSNNVFDFEEDVVGRLGCEVHTFDPTMENITMTVPPGVNFHPKGLDGADIPSKEFYRMTTLLEEMSHQNKIIDILKIDIEGSEWSAIEDMKNTGVFNNVRHLLVEFHFHQLTKPQKIRALRVFRTLYEEGFLIYNYQINSGKSEFIDALGYRVAYFVEIAFINVKFLS